MVTENNKTVIDIQKIKKTEIKDEILGVYVAAVFFSIMTILVAFISTLAFGFLLCSSKLSLLKWYLFEAVPVICIVCVVVVVIMFVAYCMEAYIKVKKRKKVAKATIDFFDLITELKPEEINESTLKKFIDVLYKLEENDLAPNLPFFYHSSDLSNHQETSQRLHVIDYLATLDATRELKHFKNLIWLLSDEKKRKSKEYQNVLDLYFHKKYELALSIQKQIKDDFFSKKKRLRKMDLIEREEKEKRILEMFE